MTIEEFLDNMWYNHKVHINVDELEQLILFVQKLRDTANDEETA